MSLLFLHVGRTIRENSHNLREHSLLIPWFSRGGGGGGGKRKILGRHGFQEEQRRVQISVVANRVKIMVRKPSTSERC